MSHRANGGWKAKTTPASEREPERRWQCDAGHITISASRPAQCDARGCQSTTFHEVLRG